VFIMKSFVSSAASKAFKIWLLGIVLGVLIAAVLPWGGSAKVDAFLSVLGGPADTAYFVWIFLKNTLASLSIIFLGTVLCILEFLIYAGVSSGTYAFLERLTDPLYALLDSFSPGYKELEPFFRSCHFYLNFVPAFAMLVNGLVLGFYLGTGLSIRLLSPHGVLEIPAMLGSAALAFYIAGELQEPIFASDSELLLIRMKKTILGTGFVLAFLSVQLLLLVGAYMESL